LFSQKANKYNRLDTLFVKGKAGGTPTSTNKEYYNGNIPFLSINDITTQGKYIYYTIPVAKLLLLYFFPF